MEDKILEQEQLKKKLKALISTMLSNRRTKLARFNNWYSTCTSILNNIFNIDIEKPLVKNGRMICFSFLHKPDCLGTGFCTCNVKDSQIQVYFLSELFMKIINSSHSQIYFRDGFLVILWKIFRIF